jgi:REP element-mobilizing transposase RayT
MSPRALWQRDHWDRYIRDERYFHAAKAYIENHPVVAGLAKTPEDWPWSSANEKAQKTPP